MIKRIPWKILLIILCILLLCLTVRSNNRTTYLPDSSSEGNASGTVSPALPDHEGTAGTLSADAALADILDSFFLMSEEQFITQMHLDQLTDDESGWNHDFILELSRKALNLFGYEIETINADDPSAENPTASITIAVNCLDYEQLNKALETTTAALAEDPDLHTMTEAEILEAISAAYLETLRSDSQSMEKRVEILMTYDGTEWILDDETILEECLFGSRL